MPVWLIEFFGWIPGIIFPAASAHQLWVLTKARSSEGVSITTWSLFSVSNFCLYMYMEKYWSPQALAFVLTGFLQIAIVLLALRKRPEKSPA